MGIQIPWSILIHHIIKSCKLVDETAAPSIRDCKDIFLVFYIPLHNMW